MHSIVRAPQSTVGTAPQHDRNPLTTAESLPLNNHSPPQKILSQSQDTFLTSASYASVLAPIYTSSSSTCVFSMLLLKNFHKKMLSLLGHTWRPTLWLHTHTHTWWMGDLTLINRPTRQSSQSLHIASSAYNISVSSVLRHSVHNMYSACLVCREAYLYSSGHHTHISITLSCHP